MDNLQFALPEEKEACLSKEWFAGARQVLAQAVGGGTSKMSEAASSSNGLPMLGDKPPAGEKAASDPADDEVLGKMAKLVYMFK